jgi:uncharacterized repeat protein (TIGR01451 family)
MNIKKLHLSIALAVGLLAVAGLLAALAEDKTLLSNWFRVGKVQAQPCVLPGVYTRYVSSNGGADTGNCTDKSDPCQTIQYTVDQANDGDEIRIATYYTFPPNPLIVNRYTGADDNVIVLTKSLTLRGGYSYLYDALGEEKYVWTPGSQPGVVDGEYTRRVLFVSGEVTPTLRTLSFVNGYADRGGNVYVEDANVRFIATPIISGTATYGGGLYLKNCQTSFDPGGLFFDLEDRDWLDQLDVSGLLLVQGNTAQYGGGIYIEGGSPVLAGLAVYSNAATADGGGVYMQDGRPTFAGGLVLENQAGDRGGGFFLDDSAARIAATAVYSNTAADGAGFYLDGPLSFSELTVPIIANNYVRYNRTSDSQGGGFYFRQAIAGLVNNVVADNQAADGAGIYLWASSPQLFHNTIAQNTGNSGIYVTHTPGQIWPPVVPIPSFPFFTNTIVVSHTVGVHIDSTGLPYPLENRMTLEGTLWWGNDDDANGAGEIVQSTDVYSDPHFKCTGGLPSCAFPYHLEASSAAADAGVVPALSIPGTDLLVDVDGQLRPSNQKYDIGADEVVTYSFDVWFMPPVSTLGAVPGQTVTHTHRLMNTGLQTDVYDLDFYSSGGWATLLSPSFISLSAQTSTTVQVRVTVPETATNNMRDTSVITAASQGGFDRKGYAVDVTSVITSDQTDLVVGKWADMDNVEPGAAVQFTLVVTNTGPLTETVVVTLTDVAAPAEAIVAWGLPSNCVSGTTVNLITCTLTLMEGTPPITQSLDVVITTTGVYSGLLVNMATVRSAVRDSEPANNLAVTAVKVGIFRQIYLPLVLRDYS